MDERMESLHDSDVVGYDKGASQLSFLSPCLPRLHLVFAAVTLLLWVRKGRFHSSYLRVDFSGAIGIITDHIKFKYLSMPAY